MEPYGSPRWPDSHVRPPWEQVPPPRKGLRHSSIAAVLFLLGVISLVCAGAYVSGELRPAIFGAEQESQAARPGTFPFGQKRDPVPGLEEANAPLGSPPPLTVPSDSYKFLAVKSDGSPLAYSPCRPIHYVVNADLAPASWQRLIDEAISEASWASGLEFIYDGTTDELPSSNRAGYQPDKYGDRWAPVLIAWTTPDLVPRLDGQTVGLGGSSSIGLSNGYKAYVTGSVSLDAPQFRDILDAPSGEAIGIAVIMHELGHLLGLDHVTDPEQLMFDEASWVRDYAAGDLAGLARLGTGPCSKDF